MMIRYRGRKASYNLKILRLLGSLCGGDLHKYFSRSIIPSHANPVRKTRSSAATGVGWVSFSSWDKVLVRPFSLENSPLKVDSLIILYSEHYSTLLV